MARRGRHSARRKPVLRPAAAATGVVALGAVAVATSDIAGAQAMGAASMRLTDSAAGQLDYAPAVRQTPQDVQQAIAQRADTSASRSSQRTSYNQRAAALKSKAKSAAALKRLQAGVRASDLKQAVEQPAAKTAEQPNSPASATQRSARTTPAPVYSGDPRSIAQAMLASYGWGQGQFGCLNSLWTKESSWQIGATNPSSGAYGIPQSLPASKMATAGPDWRTNPATQIRWGLGYIKASYGSPCSAWAHSVATNWY